MTTPTLVERLREIAAGSDEGVVARAAVVDLAGECLDEINRLRRALLRESTRDYRANRGHRTDAVSGNSRGRSAGESPGS